VDPAHHRQGIGAALYSILLDDLMAKGFCQAFACIALPNPGVWACIIALDSAPRRVQVGRPQIRSLARHCLATAHAARRAAFRLARLGWQPVTSALAGQVRQQAVNPARHRASDSSSTPSAGIDIRMASVRPPDCSPNRVPRSSTRLNST